MSKPITPARIALAETPVTLLAESSVFAKDGYKADESKAYVECAVCHSLPAGRFRGAGGAANGNELGLWAEVVAKSAGSLLHQQLNVRHQLKQYAAEADRKNAVDRIIGCVVATKVIASKHGVMRGPSNRYSRSTGSTWEDGADVHIAALMVVHKLAHGVNKILGDHITSREEQSVSIEMQCGVDQLGVMRPSTGECYVWEQMPEDWLATVQFADAGGQPFAGLPILGSIDGERLVVTYGLPGDTIQFQGIATTPNPAENLARITSVVAEDGFSTRIAAERVDEVTLPGRSVFFPRTKRTGVIDKVLTTGIKYGLRASVDKPLLRVLIGREEVFVRREQCALV